MSKIQLNWSKLIPFTEEEIKKLGVISGVYRLSKKADDEKYYVFYVGSTDDLKVRLLLLFKNDTENSKLNVFLKTGGEIRFRYAVVKEKNIQEAIEKAMFKTYLPEYNTEEPKSSLEIEANLN